MDKIEERIESLLSQMTLSEKIGQLNQIRAPKSDDEEEVFDMIRKGQVGSFIMATTAHAGNDDSYNPNEEFLNKIQKIAVEEGPHGIPIIFGRDVIHGHNTVLPVPLASAASFNNDLVEECYRDVACEAARDGVNWTFSPMLDLSRDPRWGRCIEGPGEDPFLGAEMAKSIVRGFQGDDLSSEKSIAACAKHFIGYGASEGGRDYHKTEISDYNLRNYYLPAFKAAVDSGVQTVMSAFNEISGEPMSSNRYLITDVLKKELNFNGFVVSDWWAVKQLASQGVSDGDATSAKMSFEAGIDMDMMDDCYINHMETLIKNNLVTSEQLDDAVRRILRVKFEIGLFDKPYIPKYKIDFEKHRENARKLASESIVLLKNENNVLPLKEDVKVSLIGPMANNKDSMLGSWCLDGKTEDVVSIYDGVKNHLPLYRIGYTESALYDDQLFSAYNSDVILLCLGESRKVTGEANSVAMIEVSDSQIDLAIRAKKLGKPVIAILCYGRPAAIEKLEPLCDAIIYAWHSGTQAGNAIADILFGTVNPSGKLPMTLPRCTGQIPIYYNAPSSGRNVNGYYANSLINYHDCKGTPMYRFGYGLSYSTFEISEISADKTEIPLSDIEQGGKFKFTVQVENTSSVGGSEVAQLYIRDKIASMTRPIRELKAYKKVYISSGEKKSLQFEIGFNELGFYNKDGKFAVEPGEFDIFIGNDCYAENTVKINVI